MTDDLAAAVAPSVPEVVASGAPAVEAGTVAGSSPAPASPATVTATDPAPVVVRRRGVGLLAVGMLLAGVAAVVLLAAMTDRGER